MWHRCPLWSASLVTTAMEEETTLTEVDRADTAVCPYIFLPSLRFARAFIQ